MQNSLDNLINYALSSLSDRQREVLQARYGLLNGQRLTLAAIGNKYGITRERVRQVESLAVKNLNKVDLGFVKSYLRKVGGLQRTDLLQQIIEEKIGSADFADNKVFFLLNTAKDFNYYPEDKHFYPFWYLTKDHIQKAVKLIDKLATALEKGKAKPKHPLLNHYAAVSKKFAVSPYNDFGLSCWPHICPKTARDWAYLVLKKEGRPLHFTELAKIINQLRSDKQTNAQTVHNELIKDDRFVLVGRGTYGLKEFGILPGTARQVIAYILKKHGPQTSRDLIKLVLQHRIFKENTLLLNLQDRNYFQRLPDGRYSVKEV